jgi:hypothetical protein
LAARAGLVRTNWQRSVEHAIADFAEAYADQNERDYGAFQDAVNWVGSTPIHGVQPVVPRRRYR